MSSKILVIDDHPETLRVVALILRQHGYEVVTVDSGKEGLLVAEAQRPDLILLDIMMPEMDGYEVCRRLRANPNLSRVPIILFSVKAQVDDKWAGFEAGADDYLIKPTEPAELTRRMRALLERPGGVPAPLVTMQPADDGESAEMVRTPPVLSLAGQPSLPTTGAVEFAANGVVIAVLGARGGCGTTTAAINLAVAAADDNYDTILADMDMVQGHIAMYLGQKARGGVQALAAVDRHELKLEVNEHLIREGPKLQLLLAQSNLDARLPIMEPDQVRALVGILRRRSRCLVVDLGRGLPPFGLPVLEAADQILICLRPERIAISAARQLVRQLHVILGDNRHLHALMLDFGDGTRLPKPAIEEFLHHPLLAVVPVDKKQVADAGNKNKPLVRAFPTSATAEQFRQLVPQLMPAYIEH
jgi:CheY-like chemotaxis protein/Flp pilus assembly CpaE family ATPase